MSAREDVDALVSACEELYGVNDHISFEGEDPEPMFDDDEDVMEPPSGITFWMIRRARKALDEMVAE